MYVTKERFNSNKTVKAKLADWIADSVTIMQRYAGTFKLIISAMKTEAIADKTKVVQVKCEQKRLVSPRPGLVEILYKV